jgi:hypothetical protein
LKKVVMMKKKKNKEYKNAKKLSKIIINRRKISRIKHIIWSLNRWRGNDFLWLIKRGPRKKEKEKKEEEGGRWRRITHIIRIRTSPSIRVWRTASTVRRSRRGRVTFIITWDRISSSQIIIRSWRYRTQT